MIVNIVSTGSLNVNRIDLNRVAIESPFPMTYRPRRMRSQLVIRIPSPRVTIMLYSTGKLICLGCRSIDDRHCALMKLVDALHEMGYPEARIADMRIVNVVASSCVDTGLDLTELSESYGSKAILNPEQFPGCTFRLPHGVIANAFHSGKYYVAGAKSENEALQALEQAGDILRMFPS